MYENIIVPPSPLGRRRSLDEQRMKNPNSVFNVNLMFYLTKDGPTVMSYLYFSTKFEVSADLTAIESYKGFGIYFSSLS